MFNSSNKYPIPVIFFSVAILINHIGVSFLWPIHTIYMVKVFNLNVTQSGIVLSLHFLFQFGGNLIGGVLFDKYKKAIPIFLSLLLQSFIMIVLGTNDSLVIYIVLMLPLGFLYGITNAMSPSIITSLWKDGGRRPINLLYIATNIGGAIGITIGAQLYQLSFSTAFTCSAIPQVFSLLLLFALLKFKSFSSINSNENPVRNDIRIKFNVELLPILVLSSGLFFTWLMYMQWQSTLPLSAEVRGIEVKQFNQLWTLNAVAVILLQPVLSLLLKRVRFTLKKQLLIGGGLFLGSTLITYISISLNGFIIAMLVMTIGEMFVWPGVPSLVSQISPENRLGFYQGVVSAGPTIGRMLGPILGGIVFEVSSSDFVFLFNIFVCFLAFLMFCLFDKLPKSQNLSLQKV